MIRITADAQIPFLTHLFHSSHMQLTQLPAEKITSSHLKQTDVLCVRSITRVDATLLQNTSVKLVVSPTSGADHIDHAWLTANNIAWATAPGCNAAAVVDYILSCLAYLQTQHILNETFRVGIIGVGHIGQQLQQVLTALGYPCLLNDPLRARAESDFPHTELNQLLPCHVITIHTPLTIDGPAPTRHLVNHALLQQLQPGTVIMNAARGGVIDETAWLSAGKHVYGCFDVWENEPQVDLDVLNQTTIATPHIAGYTWESKWRGSVAIWQKIHAFFQLPCPPLPAQPFKLANPLNATTWQQRALALFDPHLISQSFKQALTQATQCAHAFKSVRRDFKLRHETRLSKADLA